MSVLKNKDDEIVSGIGAIYSLVAWCIGTLFIVYAIIATIVNLIV